MKFMMIMSIMLSLITPWTHSPAPIIIMILIQSMLICFMITIMVSRPYLSFILFLVFLGAMMVLFLYITSLASNEIMSNLNQGSLQSMLMITILIISMITVLTPNNLTINMTHTDSLKFIFFSQSIFTSILSMLFLLLTLVVVEYVCFSKKSSMRSTSKT